MTQLRYRPSLKRRLGDAFFSILALLTPVLIFFVPVAAWITHVMVCIKTASWILLGFGCFVFPIGIIHGIGCWLGVF